MPGDVVWFAPFNAALREALAARPGLLPFRDATWLRFHIQNLLITAAYVCGVRDYV
jgi:hypothetical protein